MFKVLLKFSLPTNQCYFMVFVSSNMMMMIPTMTLITACSGLHKVPILALSLTFLFVYEISHELLNGFAPNSHGRLVWSLAQTSLNVKVKVTSDKFPPPLKMHCNALAAITSCSSRRDHSVAARGL